MGIYYNMKESTQQLLNDLMDCILALKSPRCKDKRFMELLISKKESVVKKINALPEEEYNLLSKKFESEFKEKIK
jgi:hypothetical protein